MSILAILREIRMAQKSGSITRREAAFALWVELGIWIFIYESKVKS